MGLTIDHDLFLLKAIRQKRFSVFFDSGATLIPRSDSDKFIEWAREIEFSILGAEGFTYSHGKLEPLMDCIIDSKVGLTANALVRLKNIIETDKAWQKADFIEFTFAS